MNVTISAGSKLELFLLGVFFSLLSVVVRSLKTVLQDKMMNKYGDEVEEQKKLTPLGSWYFQGPILLCFGIAGSLLIEGLAPWNNFFIILQSPHMARLILCNCTFA